MTAILDQAEQQGSVPIQLTPDQLSALRDELSALKARIVKSQNAYRKLSGRIRERISNLVPAAPPAEESQPGVEGVRQRTRARGGRQAGPPAGPSPIRGRPPASERPPPEGAAAPRPARPRRAGRPVARRPVDIWTHVGPLFGELPTVDGIQKLCAPMDLSWVGDRPQAQWRRQMEKFRAAAPASAQKRLLPLSSSLPRLPAQQEEEDEGEGQGQGQGEAEHLIRDRLLSAFIPVLSPPRLPPKQSRNAAALPRVLVDLPRIPTHPWLQFSFFDRLKFELMSVGLFGESGDDDLSALELDGDDDPSDVALRSQVEAVNRELAEYQQEILKHLEEWTDERNTTRTIQAAFNDGRS
jgi:hypothetical protein